MKQYWEGTVKHQITDENGKSKKANSPYLVEAVNHTEVEAILTEKMRQVVTGDFEIKPIRASDVSRVESFTDSGKYFKIKIEFLFEKEETETVLVEHDDLISAINSLMQTEEFVSELISVSRTKILDVYDSVPFGSFDFEGEHGPTDVIFVSADKAESPDEDDFLITLEARGNYSATNTDEDDEAP